MLNGQGLVGEVTSVTATTSTVLLASDSSAVVVGVALAPSGQLGWVTGPGQDGQRQRADAPADAELGGGAEARRSAGDVGVGQ